MSYLWCINQRYHHSPVVKYFASIDTVKNINGDLISKDPVSRVYRAALDGQDYYVKYYLYGGKRLRRYLLRSRARAEWENLQFFQSLGIPTVEIVAYGEERRWGLFKQGVFVTAGLEDSLDLEQFAKAKPEKLHNFNWTKSLMKLLADYIQTMHKHRFIHFDLKWRNILIKEKGLMPELFFIDCPSGRKQFGPLLARNKIKDLASMDRTAVQHISRTMRLRFFCYYHGISRLTPLHKRMIRQILNFYQRKNNRP